MAPEWLTVMSALLASATSADGGGVRRCVEVRASSQLVPVGSEVKATCVVRPDCPLLGGGVTNMELRLDRLLLARGPVTHGNRSVSNGNISNVTAVVKLNQSSALLTCCLQTEPSPSVCRLEGGLEVRAGLPPLPPGGLGCQTYLTLPSTMNCSWEPDPRDPLLRTRYTLHTRLGESAETSSYVAPLGAWRVVLPRRAFVLYQDMTLWVTASNALGDATSDPITVEPLKSVRFEPPLLGRVKTDRGGCLWLEWSLSLRQQFMSSKMMTLEARLRDTQTPSQTPTWRLATVQSKLVCDLLHGTQYKVQVRACYQGSPWSAWSPAQTGSTREKAPVGRLEYWMKEDEKDKHQAYHSVRLFWKPSRGFRPNGRVSYVVTTDTGGRQQLCSTAGSSCELRLRRRVKRVFLWALNSAGKSAPTLVPLLPLQARWAVSNLTVVSHGDHALLVQWKTGSGPTGPGVSNFVVEWWPLLKRNSSSLLFDLANRNQSSLLLTGPFEPFQPYQVSVYPRFTGAIGRPNTATAYCKQKAPSSAPDLKVRSMWQPSVELTWEELPLQERNGIISSYKLSYWADPKHITVVTVDPGNPRVLLKGLRRVTSYSFQLTVSTDGGNRSGSVITYMTLSADASDVGMLLALSFSGLSLVAFIAFTAWLRYQKRVTVVLCPMIPDPAHSSIRSWSFDTLQELSWGWEDEDPPTVSLSRLSLTELSQKAGWWEETSDLGDSVCSSPLSPCGSVSYATVLCGAPYAGQRAGGAAAFRRSESSQPLLEEERYQNLAPGELGAPGDVIAHQPFFFGEGAGSDAEWEEFPMLRALGDGWTDSGLQPKTDSGLQPETD
ncbi:granulocyte colony-stimulating factor receptor [Gadus chalcogrammus]|uniref:granulocyte colony-stimulating factor receptor n=1 Tax=Gadus chalcogrammus TaxID=1042646 RepID=UPI0024C3BDA3|nr:granulocyte colony-stimulating factor receptor [Gadus chalcogrammus]XP_056448093.1 granulocyte colony-stimulating factor receptor [Gadus chalcogrammus]XP_056448094.1 granulocyte colony-stimulating factor receptor [Gadus chalcogrammus]XP_056448095.1 granulocyte colony-stimulating factor receptor [Gadus chalcogrammus]XP_056448097.1 granulocyte colony-stimulating factor receptor [Gadus chalcogrammus]XP_056448098.1 granulocyte colony-stimulating factor receptor [Gadus chalcogrammus]